MNLLSEKIRFIIIFVCMLLCSSTLLSAQAIGENEMAMDGDSTDNERIKEYVITKAGDTIPCQIRFGMFNVMKYKPLNGKKAINFTGATVREYYYRKKDHPMVAKLLPKSTEEKFVQRLEHGVINLYEDFHSSAGAPMTSPSGMMMTGGGSSSTSWYAEKSGKLYHIKTSSFIFVKTSRKERKAAFDQLIADDPELQSEFKEKMDYSWDDIRGIINTYNSRRIRK